jgi:hypothetical protein
MEYNTEIIILRNTTNRVFISKSFEETLVYIGKLSGPFKFNMESTMVKRRELASFVIIMYISWKDF